MPKNFEVQGKQTRLFTVGELGKACGRSRDCLMVWEERGILPAPQFKYKGRRLYTEAQVFGLRKLVKEHRIKKGRPIPEQFGERVKLLFQSESIQP